MAESVVKLRVDSQEYDAKIRRAAEGLRAFGENCQKAGQSVAKADKDTLEYVRAIGQMETVSKTVRGKIGEMTTAFTELSVQYKNLTDKEKNSPFGQALSQSLDQLKTRINESKAQLSEVNQSLQGTSNQSEQTGGVMQQLANKFTLNVDVMKVFNLGMKAVGVALDVAKDAFFSNESQVDEWGRTVEAGESVYRAFVNALNNSNFSGFFNRIDGIIQKAREAYDAMDRLNTVMTIINPERAKLQARQQQLRETIRREGKDSAAGRQAQQQLLDLEPQLKASFRTEAGLNWNAFDKAVKERLSEGGINLDARSYKMLMDSFHDENAFKRLEQGARGSRTYVPGSSGTTSYGAVVDNGRWVDTRNTNRKLLDLFTDEWRQKNSPYLTAAFGAIGSAASVGLQNTRYVAAGGGGGGGRTGGGGGGGANTPPPPPEGSIAAQEAKVQALTKAWREATDEVGRAGYAGMLEEAKQVLDQMQGKTKEVIPEGSFKDLKNQLGDLQKQRELLADPVDIAIIDQDIERIKEKIDTLNGVMKQGSTPMSLEEKIRTDLADSITAVDENTLTNLLEFKIKNGLDNLDINSDYLKQAIFGERMDISDDYWQDLAERINEQLASMGIEPITIDVKTGEVIQAAKKAKDSWQDAAQAVQAVGGALQQLEDPGAKIMGIIGEAIANIALGFAQATAASAAGGPFAWISAIAGGLGTMISTISAIKSATAGSYAEGGIVPGNNYNDGLVANVSSGELILNRAQQSNIAAQLSGTSGAGTSQPYLDVETIWLGMGHYLKRKGMGEIVTTR